MPGVLRPDLLCPHCGKPVIAVFNEWWATSDEHIREYIHRGDAEIGPEGHCIEKMPYAEGVKRAQDEAARPGDPMPTDW
ncbi:MAG TPA: hypothetical protein VNN99_04515 [Vicinamibacterales bacterium]|nr:hypothetical protein [Vicinamibacterales bacterium]